MARTEKKKKSGALRAMRMIFWLLVVGCIGLAAYLFVVMPGMEPPEEENAVLLFAEGVSVEGVSLGGKTMEDAQYLLSSVESEKLKGLSFQMQAGSGSLTLTSADFDIQFNTESVLEQALQLGNTGTRKEREEERELLIAAPREFSIEYTVDVSPVKSKLQELAAAVDTPPVDASVEIDPVVSDKNWFRYTEGQLGYSLQVEELLQTLQQRAAGGEYGMVQLPLQEVEPETTVEKLKSSLLLRAKAETSFRKSPYNREDRVYNVKKAASLINGFVLKPEEVFSTNDTLGPRTYELGWKPAPAYVNGATEDQAGGGVCQVSSTLYNAVVKADLEIVYRRNHSSTVSYVPYGLDATINTGTIDFTFKNNTNAPVYIFAYTFDKKDGDVPEGQEDKTLHIEVWGEALPDEYDTIKLTSEKIETLEPRGEMEVVVDTSQAANYYNEEVKRRNGSVYQSYKHYYKNDVEVKVEPLAKSTYKAFAGRITVGPGYGQTNTTVGLEQTE